MLLSFQRLFRMQLLLHAHSVFDFSGSIPSVLFKIPMRIGLKSVLAWEMYTRTRCVILLRPQLVMVAQAVFSSAIHCWHGHAGFALKDYLAGLRIPESMIWFRATFGNME
jgi:hypothetical protein